MATAGLWNRVRHTLRRRARLLTCPHLRPAERLRAALRHHPDGSPALERRIRDRGDRLALAIAGLEFQVAAPPDPEARRVRRELFRQVVAEAFVDPVLFWGPVRPRPGDVVLDLGAHIGTTAALLARHVGPAGRVYAFEPLTVEELRANLARNRLDNVEVVPAAVADAVGRLEMTFGDTAIDSSLVRHPGWHHGRATVPVETLDHFAEARGLDRVDFIKVDIEGAEELALRGAGRLIARLRPTWSISSYHTDAAQEPQHPKLVALLKQAGYAAEEIPNFHIFAY